MGLDNGFCIKGLKNIPMPAFVSTPFGDDHICYWRKCWGIRGEINSLLHNDKPNDGIVKVDLEDIPAILRVLRNYLNPQYWEENADSIWTWDEYFDYMVDQYINLSWLEGYWKEHPELEVVWYDSY